MFIASEEHENLDLAPFLSLTYLGKAKDSWVGGKRNMCSLQLLERMNRFI